MVGRVYPSVAFHTIHPYHPLPYHTTPHHALSYYTIPHHALPYHTIPHHTILYHSIPRHPVLPLYSVSYQLSVLSLLHCCFNALFCFVHSTCMTRLLHKITTQSVSSFHALICLEGISYLFCIVCGLVCWCGKTQSLEQSLEA